MPKIYKKNTLMLVISFIGIFIGCYEFIAFYFYSISVLERKTFLSILPCIYNIPVFILTTIINLCSKMLYDKLVKLMKFIYWFNIIVCFCLLFSVMCTGLWLRKNSEHHLANTALSICIFAGGYGITSLIIYLAAVWPVFYLFEQYEIVFVYDSIAYFQRAIRINNE